MLDKIFVITVNLEELFIIEFKNACKSCTHATENNTRDNIWVLHLQVIINQSLYIYVIYKIKQLKYHRNIRI